MQFTASCVVEKERKKSTIGSLEFLFLFFVILKFNDHPTSPSFTSARQPAVIYCTFTVFLFFSSGFGKK